MAASVATTIPNQRAHSDPPTTAMPATMSTMPTPSQTQPQAARSPSNTTVCTSLETSSSYLNAHSASRILKAPLTTRSVPAKASHPAPRGATA
jgi:hypothetical protein